MTKTKLLLNTLLILAVYFFTQLQPNAVLAQQNDNYDQDSGLLAQLNYSDSPAGPGPGPNITTPEANPTAVITIEKTPAGYTTSLGDLTSGLLSIVLVIASILLLLYLIWGAVQWITSGGDKGKLESARNRITQAVIGIIVLGSVIAVFILVQRFMGIGGFNFTFASGSGGGRGVGRGGGNCTITGQPVLDGLTRSSYCTEGGAMVKCVGPDEHLDYNHYDPCYCVEGIDKQRPGYDFGC